MAALIDAGVIGIDRVPGILAWLGECWSSTTDEIALGSITDAGRGMPISQ